MESRDSSYAKNVSPDGLRATRDHRGFGGFSMGAVATWRSFQYGLDYFRYFLPMSCGTSLDMDNILAAARGHDPADYFVWIIKGTDDFAHPYDQDRAELMRNFTTFTEARDEQDGNFAIRVKDGYSHNGVAATEYTYNGLRVENGQFLLPYEAVAAADDPDRDLQLSLHPTYQAAADLGGWERGSLEDDPARWPQHRLRYAR